MKHSRLIYLSFLLFSILSCDQKEISKTSIPRTVQQDNADCERNQLQDFVIDQSQIIGGTRVLPADPEAKATVMIISTEKGTGQSFVCTATPITSRTLITAAHCLDQAAQVMAVFYVDLLCSSGFKFSRDTIRAVDFTWHPEYDPEVMNSNNPDLGLVHLSADLKPGYQIYKINLAPEALDSALILNGYGITGSSNSDSTVLRQVKLNRSEYDFEQQSIVINNNGLHGICFGDSGGPGFVTSDDELQLATVNSFGYGPRNDVCGGRASLIMIHPFLSWIHQALKKWHESLPITAN